jgi:hypothetical protein
MPWGTKGDVSFCELSLGFEYLKSDRRLNSMVRRVLLRLSRLR